MLAGAWLLLVAGCGDPDPVDETLELARFLPAGASSFQSVDVDAMREELDLAADAYTPEIAFPVRSAFIEPLNVRVVDQIVSTGDDGGAMAIRTRQTLEQVVAALDEPRGDSKAASVADAGDGVVVIASRPGLAQELVAEPPGGPSDAVVLYPYLRGSSKRIVEVTADHPCVTAYGVSLNAPGSQGAFAIRVTDAPADPERLNSDLFSNQDLRFSEPVVDESTITIDFEPVAGGSPRTAAEFLRIPANDLYACAD